MRDRRLCERIRLTAKATCTLTVDAAWGNDSGDDHATPNQDAALALFRVIQEGTTNALKHARAGAIDVALSCAGDRCVVEIRDDGVGFAPDSVTAGFGLFGLQERLRAFGGSFSIRSAPGQGTTLSAYLPRSSTVKRALAAYGDGG